jgi:segregation and condensation protein A
MARPAPQKAEADRSQEKGFVRLPDIEIACEAFSGTLGMLIHCVREHKVDLLGVPLGPICESYFRHLMQGQADVDAAAAGAAALSYLVERKSGLLLPRPEDDLPPDEDLDRPEAEPWIHLFGPAMEALQERHDERGKVFFRAPGGEAARYELPLELGEASAADLARVLADLLSRAEPEPPEALSRPRRSLTDQMKIVLLALTPELRPLDQIITGSFTRSEVVWWFLALLELIRLGQARVTVEGHDVRFAGRAA